MRVLVNGQAFQTGSTRGRGIGRYARTLLDGLARARPEWTFELVQLSHLPPIDPADVPSGVALRNRVPLTFSASSRGALWQAEGAFVDWIRADGPDVFLSMSLFELETIQPTQPLGGTLHAVVLYDLIPVIYAPMFFNSLEGVNSYSERMAAMRNAGLRLAISEATAADFRLLYPASGGRTVNIDGATEDTFAAVGNRADDAAKLAAHGVVRPFLFAGGGDCWRKNMRGCVSGFARLPRSVRDGYDLIFAGSYPDAERLRIRRLAADLGVAHQVRQLGRVTDAELAALYRSCRVFLFPSLYEGLGLPVVEALRCGAPVVTADTSSLPEFGGPVSMYCDPLEPASIGAAILAALEEPADARRAARIAYGHLHTPETVGTAAALAIEQAVEAGPLPARPRLAWFTDLDADGGLSTQERRLIDGLADRFEIELVAPPGFKRLVPTVRLQYPVVPAESFVFRHRVPMYRYAGGVFAAGSEGWRRQLPPLSGIELSGVAEACAGWLSSQLETAGISPLPAAA